MKLLLLLSAFVVATHASSGGDWTYNTKSAHGPSHWPDDCHLQHNNKGRQSPISIPTNARTKTYSPFRLRGYANLEARIFNTGSTVEVEIEKGEPILSGGGLPGNYKLAQFHFHWGSNNGKGSEHKLNGIAAPMEVHFVHHSTKYKSVKEAATKDDGLAVLSWLFEVKDSSEIAAHYADLFDNIPSVISTSSSGVEIHIDAEDFMGDIRNGAFFRYDGSLTTPGCYESVIWTVFEEKIHIEEDELKKLRRVKSKRAKANGLASDNYRPTQDLNGRTIRKSPKRNHS